MTILWKALAALAVTGLATATIAQSAEIDTNEDGLYSYPELQVAMPDMTEEEFMIIDVNGDGLLDMDEVAAATDAGLLPVMEG